MKFLLVNVSKDILSNVLLHVLKAISANCPIPILSGIKIQAHKDGLTLTASNTSMTIEYRIPLDIRSMIVKRVGEIVVPARYFNEIIRKLDSGFITLETKEHFILTIQSGNSHFRLCGMDSTEFPIVNFSDNYRNHKIRINNVLLRSIIKQVVFAVSTSESRPVLTGVSFEWYDHSLSLIATDGIRLASRMITIETYGGLGSNVIIPGKNLSEISKILTDDNSTTEVEVGMNQIKFQTDELVVYSALIEGTYPSIKNIIPQSYISQLIVDTACFLHAIERVSVLASESIIKLILLPPIH